MPTEPPTRITSGTIELMKLVKGDGGHIINVPKERCGTCDRDAYHENDWHCSQGKEKEEEWVYDVNGKPIQTIEDFRKEFAGLEEEEEEYICDEKENCKDSLECNGCYPQDAWWKEDYAGPDVNGNTPEDYKKAEEECPKGYCVVWNSYEKGFKYRKIDEDGYIMDEDLYGQEAAKKEKKQEIIAKIKKEIPFVDIKPFSHNIITLELGLLEEVAGREAVVELVQTTELKNKGWGFITSIEG